MHGSPSSYRPQGEGHLLSSPFPESNPEAGHSLRRVVLDSVQTRALDPQKQKQHPQLQERGPQASSSASPWGCLETRGAGALSQSHGLLAGT